jgi:uncharacterized protein (UPF0335 family)
LYPGVGFDIMGVTMTPAKRIEHLIERLRALEVEAREIQAEMTSIAVSMQSDEVVAKVVEIRQR